MEQPESNPPAAPAAAAGRSQTQSEAPASRRRPGTEAIKQYLLENSPAFVRCNELRIKGWQSKAGDKFFEQQRKKADEADPPMARKFFNMMIRIAKEIQSSTGALTIPSDASGSQSVLDMCMAPGGFLQAVLDFNPRASADAFSLPARDGGHRVLLRQKKTVFRQFLDVTMLAGDMGATNIPAYHPDAEKFFTEKLCSGSFGLVLCDGQVLRTHKRAAYRERVEARRLTLTQLTIGLEHLNPGGTILVLLHKPEAYYNVCLLRTFSKFSSLRLFKSTTAHISRSSFYMVASNVQSQSSEAKEAVAAWKRDWMTATFGNDEEKEAMMLKERVDVEVLLKEFGGRLVEMGDDIWRIQTQGLAKASFMKG